ncbi:hypothetical protein JD844_014298 [Phrynosoma platyrhinos]|uniref:non-specific serine/threonine protein kinase n=1 Tax=Phrynosoma platyrhinos TaxID=52577 RepID=A0ABQ7SR89_PHRPL|nr:hypothetical protein JD844_014298 [Phrynosoma platyrhinos]
MREQKEFEQGVCGESVDRDWDPQDDPASLHRGTEGLSVCTLNKWDKEYIYLIMEFCAGGDLSRFIHSRRILPEKVARLFLQQLGEE